jgi:hypothetical protein
MQVKTGILAIAIPPCGETAYQDPHDFDALSFHQESFALRTSALRTTGTEAYKLLEQRLTASMSAVPTFPSALHIHTVLGAGLQVGLSSDFKQQSVLHLRIAAQV